MGIPLWSSAEVPLTYHHVHKRINRPNVRTMDHVNKIKHPALLKSSQYEGVGEEETITVGDKTCITREMGKYNFLIIHWWL